MNKIKERNWKFNTLFERFGRDPEKIGKFIIEYADLGLDDPYFIFVHGHFTYDDVLHLTFSFDIGSTLYTYQTHVTADDVLSEKWVTDFKQKVETSKQEQKLEERAKRIAENVRQQQAQQLVGNVVRAELNEHGDIVLEYEDGKTVSVLTGFDKNYEPTTDVIIDKRTKGPIG